MMKVFLFSLLALAGLTSPAMAALTLELRPDYDAGNFNRAAKAAGAADETAFTLNTARLDLRGDMNEDLSYRLRFRLNNESTDQGVDSLSSRVDHASITHRLGQLALTFGKTNTDVGGHETISDARDLYFKSEASTALTGPYGALSNGAQIVFHQAKYDTGVKATIDLGASDLILMAMNSPESEAKANPRPHKHLMHGAVWKGQFAENRLQPVLSYHAFKSNSDSTASGPDTQSRLMAAGLKWTQEGSFVQLDYVQLNAKNLTLTTTSDDFAITSWVAEGGYKIGDWTPRLKAEISKVKESPETGASLTNDFTGYGVSIEYTVPEMDLARYHLALTQKNMSQANAADQIENRIIAGFVLSYDLLK